MQLAEKNITLHVMPTEITLLLNRRYWSRRWGIYWITPRFYSRERSHNAKRRSGSGIRTLKVLDTGSGIPDYALSRILNAFTLCRVQMGKKAAVWGWVCQ